MEEHVLMGAFDSFVEVNTRAVDAFRRAARIRAMKSRC
jgi:hypothetical protein